MCGAFLAIKRIHLQILFVNSKFFFKADINENIIIIYKTSSLKIYVSNKVSLYRICKVEMLKRAKKTIELFNLDTQVSKFQKCQISTQTNPFSFISWQQLPFSFNIYSSLVRQWITSLVYHSSCMPICIPFASSTSYGCTILTQVSSQDKRTSYCHCHLEIGMSPYRFYCLVPDPLKRQSAIKAEDENEDEKAYRSKLQQPKGK